MSTLSPKDVDRELVVAHEAVAKLKWFVLQEEARKIERQQHQRGEQGASRQGMPPPPQPRAQIFDSVMQWIRSTVLDAASGHLLPWTDDLLPAAGASSTDDAVGERSADSTPTAATTSSTASLRYLVQALTEQLEHERAAKQFAASALHSFNTTLEGYRTENCAMEAYRDRIIELQAVINHTKRYSEIDTEVGYPRARLVPSDCVPSQEQARREVANQLASVAVAVKDKMERVQAENIKLSSDRLLLQAENKLLLDRVRVLEAQLVVLNAGSAINLRELNKARSQSALMAATAHLAGPVRPASRQHQGTSAAGAAAAAPLSSESVVIGGVAIEKEIALWLRDVYLSLLEHPNSADVLESYRKARGARTAKMTNAGQQHGPPSQRRPVPTTPASIGSSHQHQAAQNQRSGASSGTQQRLGSAESSVKGDDKGTGTRTSSARSFAEHVSSIRATSAESRASAANATAHPSSGAPSSTTGEEAS